MKKSYADSRRKFENAKRIWRLEEDWITPAEYLPYIAALFEYHIDLEINNELTPDTWKKKLI